MRGRPLILCARGHEPICYTGEECPICSRERRIRELVAEKCTEQDRRCAECQKHPRRS